MAGVAELRRFAGGLGWLGAEVVVEDAPHAGHVQLAEPVHVGLALHRDAGGTDGFDQVRIAFLDDHTTADPFHKLRDLLHRQWMREPQLEHPGFGRGFPHVHEGNPRSDDTERLAAFHDVA